MGAFLYRKVRRSIKTTDLATNKEINQPVLLSGVDKARVVKVQGEETITGLNGDVKVRTAWVETEPGRTHRISGFNEFADQVAKLEVNQLVTAYGHAMKNGGLRISELYPQAQPQQASQSAA